MTEFLKIVDMILGKAMRWFCVANLLALTVVLGAVVFIRFFPVAKLRWSDEIIEWLIVNDLVVRTDASRGIHHGCLFDPQHRSGLSRHHRWL